jgi:hypothetical protein
MRVVVKVAEQFLRAKTRRDKDCEDGIVVAEAYAAVIDGATDKTGFRFDGPYRRALGNAHLLLGTAIGRGRGGCS